MLLTETSLETVTLRGNILQKIGQNVEAQVESKTSQTFFFFFKQSSLSSPLFLAFKKA
jgi:hypothetical protein